MAISFNILGTTLSFHNDLRKYYHLSCEFQTVHDKLARKVHIKLNSQKEPSEILSSIENETKKFISELINRLSNFGLFERVASDYLNENNGYLNLLTCTTEYYEYCAASTEKHSAIAESNKQSANATIISSINGLDFGIISSSIIDHAVYAAMNKSEIRKQSLAASERYISVCNMINNTRDKSISADIKAYYLDKYVPSLESALTELFIHLLTIFANDLNNCKQLDLHCLEAIDLKRSNEIIDNIANIDNKQGVFLKAIELCPYNLNAYTKGFAEFFVPNNISFVDVCGEIIKFFGLEGPLSNILVPLSTLREKAVDGLKKKDFGKATELFAEISKLYPKEYSGWVGLLLSESENFTKANPNTSAINGYYNKAKQFGTESQKKALENAFSSYIVKINKYNRLIKEYEEETFFEKTEHQLREAELKNCNKWLCLSIFFGVITGLNLIVALNDSSFSFLMLFSAGVTALQIFMYGDSKKKIVQADKKIADHLKKEEEIRRLKSNITTNIDLSTLL